MKKFVLLIATAIFLLTDADAFNVNQLANNKEAFSRELSKQDIQHVETWMRSHRLGSQLKLHSVKVLQDTFNEMERIDTTCELGLVERLEKDAQKFQVIHNSSDMPHFIAYLRHQDLIDDILYRMMKESLKVSHALVNADSGLPRRPFNVNTRQNSGIDLAKFYSPTKQWPDDKAKCTIDMYWKMVSDLTWKNGKDRDNQMQKLNYLAYADGHIDLQTYNRMETMRKLDVLGWPVYFKRYADVVNNAKDKLTKKPEIKTTHNFSVEYVSRKEQLTKRTSMYASYNSTQIMMLAQIMEKAANRMDAKRAYLRWEFQDNSEGDHEIYVLSPMEQYRLAIKMLRKDMAEVMRSEAFRHSGVAFEDLIAAAFETGFIKSEELDHVLKFEDLWNPKTPKWKKYADFAFSIAGSASFYLPPPFNIIGAIGLVLVQSKLVNGDQQPDADDNWNVII